jgi:Raf kinase inhibitor-like YbhB/YbcL family protein
VFCFKAVLLLLASTLAACSSGQPGPTSSSSSPTATATSSAGPFALTSTDLNLGRWPANFTCDGSDDPPNLHWTAGPKGTMSYALQVFDPDAPRGGFAHWMLANEPASLREPTPNTGVSGQNDFGKEGYQGPCPPHGSTHHYVVTVYAVDRMLSLQTLYSHQDFERALNGHVLAQASITATYAR